MSHSGKYFSQQSGKYRKRLRTTNMQEHLNEEIRRRERVIRISPNDESALRLIGALLAEQNEAWLERKYWMCRSITNGRRISLTGSALLQHSRHNLIVGDQLGENLQQISDLAIPSNSIM